MARWSEVEAAEPELCARVRARFEAHRHKFLATIRSDGSPRVSGIEVIFSGGDVWAGSMRDAVKARDLARDPRFALHSGSADPPGWEGDAKLAGRAEEVSDQATLERVMADAPEEVSEGEHSIESMHLFRFDLDEVVSVGLNEDRSALVIESWHPGRGLVRRER